MAIENKFLDSITNAFSIDLPEMESLDQYLDFIIPLIKKDSEDLREEEFYLSTRWLEVRDEEHFHESILHIFNKTESEEGTERVYKYILNGNVNNGKWELLPKSNSVIIERWENEVPVQSELFDLAFLNTNFLILKKHGNQKQTKGRKYFVMGNERAVKGLEWREVVELINQSRKGNSFVIILIFLLIIVGLFVVFSRG